MSTSGFEALPAREGGRHKRPRKLGAGCVSEGGAAAPAAPAHSYTVTVGAAAVAAEGAPVYDSALFSSAEREDEKPGEVEGSGGMGKWEYLDHTADVQIHTWGASLPEAFAQQALAMWGYMTDLRSINVDSSRACVIEARGVDLISLLFAWMDGCLYAYGSEYFVGREVAVTHWSGGGAEGWRMRAVARGERFEFGRHPQGTEVKAITYSNMQIFNVDGTLVTANDASDAAARAAAEEGGGGGAAAGGGGGGGAPAAAGAEAPTTRAGARRAEVDVYVIVDI